MDQVWTKTLENPVQCENDAQREPSALWTTGPSLIKKLDHEKHEKKEILEVIMISRSLIHVFHVYGVKKTWATWSSGPQSRKSNTARRFAGGPGFSGGPGLAVAS